MAWARRAAGLVLLGACVSLLAFVLTPASAPTPAPYSASEASTRGGKTEVKVRAQGGPPAFTLTTLFGRALLKPTCPTEREPDGDCESRPLPGAEIVLQTEDGSQDIVILRADDRGFFGLGFVGLPPGGYRLHPLAPQPGLPPYPPDDALVEIRDGQLTYVEIVYDSGVR